MSDGREAWLDAEITKRLDERGELAPPWAACPEIPQGSIGWRMGHGEGWLVIWHAWLARQPADREHRLAYLRRHPPAPRNWQDTALWVVDPALMDDDDVDEHPDEDQADERRLSLLGELERAGVIADDAALGAWLARNDPPQAPWVRTPELATAARYGARELTFFVRWALRHRDDEQLAAWLERAPAVPSDWRAFRDALVRREPPPTLPADPREQLAILLAAHGEPPPPWTRGEAPAALQQQFEDRTTYAGAWSEWAMESFDDTPTWLAYLQRWPAAPPQWAEAIREELSWLF